MAQPDVQTATAVPIANFNFNPVIQDQLHASNSSDNVSFDPKVHLAFKERPSIVSMKDLDFPEDKGISPVAVSDPFPLFSEDAMRIMRKEIFSTEVWKNCLYSGKFAASQLRGHCPEYAPFMTQAWTNPETLAAISKVAGIDLVPMFDIELGNINVSVQETGEAYGRDVNQSKDDIPLTKWHVDSYPFVCVVMMSDTTNMEGGETAIKTGKGDIIKVRGPSMGCGVILQGRYIHHQALAARGGKERITMITAFRPRDPLAEHSAVLTSIRPLTEPSELYFQWTEYRIEVLQARLSHMLELLREEHRAGKTTDTKRIKEYLALQEKWLSATHTEIIPEEPCALVRLRK